MYLTDRVTLFPKHYAIVWSDAVVIIFMLEEGFVNDKPWHKEFQWVVSLLSQTTHKCSFSIYV